MFRIYPMLTILKMLEYGYSVVWQMFMGSPLCSASGNSFVVLPERSGGSKNFFKEKSVSASLIAMYEWRKMSAEQRRAVMQERKMKHLPWHAPRHFGVDKDYYHISAACYEHAPILNSSSRLTGFELKLISGLTDSEVGEVRAWVVLPNDYHLLIKTKLPEFGRWIARFHNQTSTKWNGEDQCRGRKVWHRFSDRRIRGEVHFCRSVNYIHANPVKHGYVDNSADWVWSSFIGYEEKFGREELVRWWREFLITGYGEGWDD